MCFSYGLIGIMDDHGIISDNFLGLMYGLVGMINGSYWEIPCMRVMKFMTTRISLYCLELFTDFKLFLYLF